jgi:hypothetical protein
MADLEGEAYVKYRVCVAGSRPACTRPARPTIRKRQGRVELVHAPSQVVPEEQSTIVGHVSRFLRSSLVRLQYQNAQGEWVTLLPGSDSTYTGYPAFNTFALSPNLGPGLASPARRLRIHASATRDVAAASSKPFTVAVYRYVRLSALTPTAGSLVNSFVTVYYGPSEGSAPAGSAALNSTTLTLPAGCGRVVFGVVIDRLLVQPDDTYSAALAVDGTTLWSHAPADPEDPLEHQITLPPNAKQLTLTSSYDAGAPDRRPWFVDPDGSKYTPNSAAHVLCTS